MRSAACFAVLLSLLTSVALADGNEPANSQPESEKPAIGSKVDQLTFKDIRFLERSLADLEDARAFVIMYTTLECPLVQRYFPKIIELEKQYRDQGVQFIAINVGPEDSLVEVAQQGLEAGAELIIGKDFTGNSVRATGVERTPEVVILDADHVLRYRGRIDDQYRLGGVRPNVTQDSLVLALEDVLAGRDVAVAETPVDGCRITFRKLKSPVENVTYAEHIAGIMQQHCQECHRPDTTAPFSLLTYEDTVNYAEMIAEVVIEQRMPPKYSSDKYGHFTNIMQLSRDERAMVAQWVNNDCPQGDMSQAPEPLTFRETEWAIDTPDLVLQIPKPVSLPASGYVKYKYVFLPHMFKEDTWVQQIEILPTNHAVVHHANLAVVQAGNYSDADFITGFVPGGSPMQLTDNVAYLIPKGSALVLQIHYVTTGKEETDQLKVGLVYAKEPIHKRLHHFRVTTGQFEIPPHAAHHEVRAVRTLPCDATAVGMFVHMHLRGKDMIFHAHHPDGNTETLLSVPNYNFDWQLAYRYPENTQKFASGTKIECIAHYDNSKFNPYNPDPTAAVREGDQTYEEMMFGFFFYTDDNEHLDLRVDPNTGLVIKPAEADNNAQASLD